MKEVDSTDATFPSITVCNQQPYSELKLQQIIKLKQSPIPNMAQYFGYE